MIWLVEEILRGQTAKVENNVQLESSWMLELTKKHTLPSLGRDVKQVVLSTCTQNRPKLAEYARAVCIQYVCTPTITS